MAEEAERQPLHVPRPQKLSKFSGVEEVEPFIREAKLLLQLQPMTNPVAAGWIISALEGPARQEVLSMGAEEVNTPEKVYAVLEQHWGEQRDTTLLAGTFFKRQQGLTESVGEFATALRLLWTKTNTTKADTLSVEMLRDTFASGLYPVSLRRDMKRYLREKENATFADVTKEAQRWMREDNPLDTMVQQTIATPDPDAMCRLEAQIAALTSETASLKQQLREQSSRSTTLQEPNDSTQHGQTHHNGNWLRDARNRRGGQGPTCWWCRRPGHREAECRAKQQYQRQYQRFPQGSQGHQQHHEQQGN